MDELDVGSGAGRTGWLARFLAATFRRPRLVETSNRLEQRPTSIHRVDDDKGERTGQVLPLDEGGENGRVIVCRELRCGNRLFRVPAFLESWGVVIIILQSQGRELCRRPAKVHSRQPIR